MRTRNRNRTKERAYAQEYRRRFPEKFKAALVRHRRKLKRLCMSHYGTACVCCGETILEFLTLDHSNRDGASHRKTIFGGRNVAGARFYTWLKKNDFPKDLGLQVMCYNCNCGRQSNGGICPHKETPPCPTNP